MKSRPVVVAIADKQPCALRFAVSEARSLGAPLRVVYAYGVQPRASQFNVVEEGVVEGLRALGRAVLDAAGQFIEELESGVSVEYVLSRRAPLDALDREALNARMLVLGADDVPWFDRLFRTRIAGHLAKHAPCPVVVVPELQFPTSSEGEVVLTLDGATSAAGPLRFAFEEANARDCLLHVLHASPPGTLSSDAEASRANVSEVLAGWRETYPDVAVLEGDPIGDAPSVIVRATRSAELVIVGRPHNQGVLLSLSRPVATQVLAKAQCPVAVVPADYR